MPEPARAPLIVSSVLPADFARLGHEVRNLCDAGVDRIQWDVMDGVFVPNLTFGPDVIAAARPHSAVEPKVARLRQMIDDSGLSIELEVDGGITVDTIGGAASAVQQLRTAAAAARRPNGEAA